MERRREKMQEEKITIEAKMEEVKGRRERKGKKKMRQHRGGKKMKGKTYQRKKSCKRRVGKNADKKADIKRKKTKA